MRHSIIERLQTGKGKQQLICFPFLGGNASSFQPLCARLSNELEVWAINPPGHGHNQAPLLEEMEQMVECYVAELLPVLQANVILLGHSLGGIAAYFVAQRLKQLKAMPCEQLTLVLSACSTPEEFKGKQYSELPSDQLIEHLSSYGGIPEPLLAERELLEFFMPMIRADFRALQSSALMSYERLELDAYYLWGTSDVKVDLIAALKWSRYIASSLSLIPIQQGSHMFITELADVVATQLEEIAAASVKHILN